MHEGAAPILQHTRIFESRDPERTRAFMAGKEFYLDLPRREAGAFDFAASALYLPNGYIGYVQYGSATTVRVPAERRRDDYFLHLPLDGAAEVANDAGAFACAPGKAVISSPTGHVMRAQPASGRVTVSLTRSVVIAQLVALLGEAPARPLKFVSAVDLGIAEGRRIGRQVRAAIADLEDMPPSGASIMSAMHEQMILTTLLLDQPNNYSDALHGRSRDVARCDIARAIDYMQAHLDSPIALADVVAASGAPGRTLLKHFRDARGTSPMRYLRHARLVRARQALLAARRGETVTHVALAWGLDHLGRFALEYRALFGESPSETLRRARRLHS